MPGIPGTPWDPKHNFREASTSFIKLKEKQENNKMWKSQKTKILQPEKGH